MENLKIRKLTKHDIDIIPDIIKLLASYEKRPHDMTATKQDLSYQLFDRNIETFLVAEDGEQIVGYAIYYPMFASFSGCGKIYIEDILIKKEFRGKVYGSQFFKAIQALAKSEGYSKMEWSCLDWNTPSIAFYEKMGAEIEKGSTHVEKEI